MEIRNFVIIAHVDHGKSTLADRFLELTGTVEPRKMHSQYLDTLALEQERGITIKLQPVRMVWRNILLNLIDTPGHSDFAYEVSRSIAAVEGAILLVDASQGIQAQTLAVLEIARAEKLKILPVVNKIDLAIAQPEETALELKRILNCKDEEILFCSAKTGEGVKEILDAVVERVPPPQTDASLPLRALVFDSIFDPYRGIVIYVRIVDGGVKKGEKLELAYSGKSFQVLEVGSFFPERRPSPELFAGEIGYLVTDLKELSEARIGDTVRKPGGQIVPLPGYREPQPLLYSDIYPTSSEDTEKLRKALLKLRLSDPAFTFEAISLPAFGSGFRIGVLGSLHLEILKERLFRDEGVETFCTLPLAPLKVYFKDGRIKIVKQAESFPELAEIERVEEPYVLAEVILPSQFLGSVIELFSRFNSEILETESLSEERLICRFATPLLSLISELSERLKSVSRGYATISYHFLEYRPANLVRLDIFLSGEKIPALAQVVRKEEALEKSKEIALKLKQILPRQLFEVVIQVASGSRILAKETLPPLRKDVIAKLYGGDVSRKKKLLEKQKEGKKRLKSLGRVSLPSDIFLRLFKS